MELKPGTILNDMYRVKKLLGKGAMGNVYLVERLSDKNELVVKELNFSSDSGIDQNISKEIFFREAEFMAKFDHAALPRIYGIFTQDDRDYLAMDYIKGQTLEDVINKKRKPLPLEKALKLTIQIASVLDYLHNSFSLPVVYRDLKPSNIIVTSDEKVRLIDFGTTRYYNPDKVSDTFRLGSPGYAAPEQYKGRGQSTPQSDIFALGVILFQMLTKYDPTIRPFKFPSMKSLNPSIDKELTHIVTRAIELEPVKRYISAVEFKESLEKYLEKIKSSRKTLKKLKKEEFFKIDETVIIKLQNKIVDKEKLKIIKSLISKELISKEDLVARLGKSKFDKKELGIILRCARVKSSDLSVSGTNYKLQILLIVLLFYIICVIIILILKYN